MIKDQTQRTMRNTIMAALLLLVCGCNKGTDQNSDSAQRERIISYTSELTTPVRENDGMFITRLNKAEADPGRLRVTNGDSLWVFYAMYTFQSRPDSLFVTNIPSVAEENGFDLKYVEEGPLGIRYGHTDLIKGFELGLEDGQEGDSLMMFVPSKLAYGNKSAGVVEKFTTIAIFAEIKRILKND